MQPQLHTHLAPLTTFQIGGEASYFFAVDSIASLHDAVQFAHDEKADITVIGGGSNVLVSDVGVSGVVLHNQLHGISFEPVSEHSTRVAAAAGETFDELVAACVLRGLGGLENLSHIPGSVGAAPIQNIGAYGVEVADVIESVTVFNPKTMTEEVLSNAACQFGYRDSYFKTESGKSLIVTAVAFLLDTQSVPNITYRDLRERFATTTPTIAEVREAVIDIRAKKFPDWHTVGTAGSFFKNPIISRTHYEKLLQEYPEMPMYEISDSMVKVPLAWILDKVCHRKGFRDGMVGHYEAQPLVIINHGGATAAEVIRFANATADAVKEKTQIDMEWEVTRL